MDNFDHILLFKTNINCDSSKQLLHKLLDTNPGVDCWTIDMEDKDCVLRIVSYHLSHNEIIKILNLHGFQCCELT